MSRKLDGAVAVIMGVLGLCGRALVAANGPAADAARVELSVREAHGIRRFGYPVSAEFELNPPAAAQSRFRLLHDGTPVVAQFRPIGPAGDNTARVALDFDSNFLPFETREYVVEYGRDVPAGPEPERGMTVEQTDQSFVVSNGPSLVWTVPKSMAGLLRSVKTPKLEYVRRDSAGLSMRLKDGSAIRLGDSPKWVGRGSVIKSGPIDCKLQFQFADPTEGIACTVDLEFPRSKSWVGVTWTVDDPQDRIAELLADLNLELGDGPTLADFGADNLVYATVPDGQVAVFEAAVGTKSPAASPSWRVSRGLPSQLEPYVFGRPDDSMPIQGWAHAMDRQRCTALALADCGQNALDRIEVGADGHLQVARRPAATHGGARSGQKRLDFWVHFVPFPPHVGAVTSPQSMQSPLVVQVRAASGRATQGTAAPSENRADSRGATPPSFTNLESLESRAKAALSKTSGEIPLAGLLDRVEVLRDKWGVPHIYAQNDDDLFFAQGFVQAQDRLWQMDIWRRTTEGKLAEIVGADAIERDRFARLMEYRGDIDSEWASYGPDSRRIIESFVRGVNACIELSRDNLPIEFQLTGLRPEPWTPRVCIGRMAGFIMCRNASNEVMRAQLVREIGASAAAQLMPLDPIHEIKVPDGLDLAGIDQRVLTGLNAVNAAIRVPLAGADSNRAAQLGAPTDRSSDDSSLFGSNNWVISGRLTNTGKPILANDPHRPITLPSLRYLVHLNCPSPNGANATASKASARGWNVIGGTEPALPGVAIGHNEHIAWGMTIVGTDQSDIYVEETHPDDPNRYRVADRWEPMQIEQQQIAVRGEAQPRAIDLKFTRHGPVIWEDPEHHRAFALRWTGREPGTAGYMGALALDRASNWAEFVEAAGRWKVPSENLVYADVDGNIGWIAAALTPIRPQWDGLLPVPGSTGKYEWSGFLTASQLPAQFNPTQGYIATANHNILPQSYPHHISFEWSAPYRFQRIDQMFRDQIQRQQKFTIGQSQAMQHDATSLAANRLLDMLAETTKRPAELNPAIELLLSWRANSMLQEDSAAAALFEVWQKVLAERILRPRLPDKLWERYSSRIPTQAMLSLLDDPNSDFGRNSHQRRDSELLQSLAAASTELEKLLGPDRSAWRWGALHQAHFRHMLGTPWKPADLQKAASRTASRTAEPTAVAKSPDSAAGLADPVDRDTAASSGTAISTLLDLRSVSRAGDANSPIATGGPNYQQTTGASYRQIIDFADWDRSVASSVPGQSGQPMSPHYGDLLEPWGKGEYFPVSFSRAAVEANCAQKLVLSPAHPK